MKSLIPAVAAVVLGLLLTPAPAGAAAESSAATAGGASRPHSGGGWHGRAIRAPHHHPTQTTARTATTGIRRGTGYLRPNGSRRVRAIQRALIELGYRPGRVDGRFGPRTEAALRWFEHKHGLETGRTVSVATVRHLHRRAAGDHEATANGTRNVGSTRAAEPRSLDRAASSAAPAAHTAPPLEQQGDDGVALGVLGGVALLGLVLLALGSFQAGAIGRRRARTRSTDGGGP